MLQLGLTINYIMFEDKIGSVLVKSWRPALFYN